MTQVADPSARPPQPPGPPRARGLQRLNPFYGLKRPREVWAWAMYDLANQSFTLHINTLLFAIFFKQVIVQDDKKGDGLWGLVVASSLLLVVIVSPIAGAIADFKAWKKQFLIGLGVVCVIFTCSLGLLEPGWVWLAIALYIPANFAFALGENFLAAFLPELAEPRNLGRVSAIGWTSGYVGALVLLLGTVAAMNMFGLAETEKWRPFLVFAGIWFLVMATPTALILKERQRPQPVPRGRTMVGIAFSRLADTVRAATQFRHFLTFLAAFFIYAMGVQTMIFFAVIIAADFGFEGTRLVWFLLPVTVMAGVGAMGSGVIQDRLGHKPTVAAFLVVWIATAIGLLLIPEQVAGEPARGEWIMWLVANAIGLALGGIGTASRAFAGALTPRHKSAEFFGLWGLAYKLAGVVGVGTFGLVKAGLGNNTAFIILGVVFSAGLAAVLFINVRAGEAAAREAEIAAGPAAADAADAAAIAAAGPDRPTLHA